jgi:hypothetical protein
MARDEETVDLRGDVNSSSSSSHVRRCRARQAPSDRLIINRARPFPPVLETSGARPRRLVRTRPKQRGVGFASGWSVHQASRRWGRGHRTGTERVADDVAETARACGPGSANFCW